MTDWHRIDGPNPPPRDGTKIVIAHPDWDCFPVAVWMEYPSYPVMDGEGRDVWMSGWGHDASGFHYGCEDYWLGWAGDPEPTHWMPLPAPPTDEVTE